MIKTSMKLCGREKRSDGGDGVKRLPGRYSTSERSAEAAAHTHGTAHRQNICVTVRVLLTQETGKNRETQEGSVEKV